ncbi:MAG: phosphotransferase [Planctomycetaceae bacterium]|nr:phosphotransferase [Planctomycetaceae bacterium]
MSALVPELISVLRQWLPTAERAQLSGLGAGSSFSGAGLWRVEHGDCIFVLRRWPPASATGCRVTSITSLQRHLAEAGLPIASPLPLLDHPEALVCTKIAVDRDVAAWTLTPWLPGVADYWITPRHTKLKAAARTLAEIHLSASSFPVGDRAGPARIDRSPALVERGDRLEALKSGACADLAYHLVQTPPTAAREIAFEALELIQRSLGRLWQESLRWCDERLALQWVIRDVWHDHVLFTEDKVTGVIDFGAAAVDSPAGDLARLLGSLVGDDEAAWRLGVEVYQTKRPLAPIELEAVRFFDASGTLLSAFNWVHWLFRDPSALGPNVDRNAASRRLERLVGRMRRL